MSELAKALLEFQKDAPALRKDQKAEVVTKSGRKYTYGYAGLPAVMEAVRPALNKQGLVVVQEVGNADLTTRIIHAETGEELHATLALGHFVANDIQGLGSLVTYARRYSLVSMLGLVADEDTDAQEIVSADEVRNRQPSQGSPPEHAAAAEPFPVSKGETLPPKATAGQKAELREHLEQLYLQAKRAPGNADRTWTEFALAFATDQFDGVKTWEDLNRAQFQTVIEYMRPFLKEQKVTA